MTNEERRRLPPLIDPSKPVELLVVPQGLGSRSSQIFWDAKDGSGWSLKPEIRWLQGGKASITGSFCYVAPCIPLAWSEMGLCSWSVSDCAELEEGLYDSLDIRAQALMNSLFLKSGCMLSQWRSRESAMGIATREMICEGVNFFVLRVTMEYIVDAGRTLRMGGMLGIAPDGVS